MNRILKPGGKGGTVTWGPETVPEANLVWYEERGDNGDLAGDRQQKQHQQFPEDDSAP